MSSSLPSLPYYLPRASFLVFTERVLYEFVASCRTWPSCESDGISSISIGSTISFMSSSPSFLIAYYNLCFTEAKATIVGANAPLRSPVIPGYVLVGCLPV